MNARKIGQRARQLRQQLKLTQKQLGTILNISGGTVSGYELGDNCITIDSAVALAKLANVSLDWLILGEQSSGELPHERLPDDETQLLTAFRKLGRSEQKALLKLATAAAKE